MKYFKQLTHFQAYDLYNELNNLVESNTISWPTDGQICLNTLPTQPDNYLLGCGSLKYNWSGKKEVKDQFGNLSLEVPEHEVVYSEDDFSFLCSQFHNTLFEKIYNSLSKFYVLGRVRIMKSKPKTCMSWHVDSTHRIHYSIKTQNGCFMVIKDEVLHLPQDTWWWTNTTKPHTAFNGSKEERIHLVAVVLGEK